jgi:hypothetical protein
VARIKIGIEIRKFLIPKGEVVKIKFQFEEQLERIVVI